MPNPIGIAGGEELLVYTPLVKGTSNEKEKVSELERVMEVVE